MTGLQTIGRTDSGLFEFGSPLVPELNDSATVAPAAPARQRTIFRSRLAISRKRFLLWGSACFVLSVGFGLAANFQNIMTMAGVDARPNGAPAAIAAEQPALQQRPTVPACTALVLDRTRNVTYARPCEIEEAHSIHITPLQASYSASNDVVGR